MRIKLKYSLFYILAVIIFINLLLLLLPSLGIDEAFTLSLINHSYLNIINIDLLDVHPPLFYIVLKFFLIITTFWTNSIFIKIIFARLFSLLSFFIFSYFSIKILKLLHIKVNLYKQFILYLVFPSISFYSLNIRMYQFCAMLLVSELYGILLYEYHKKGLFFIFISLLFCLYSNYFSAMFGGIMLVIEFLYYLMMKDKRYKRIFFVGILDMVCSLPLFQFFLHQIRYVSSNKYSNFVKSTVISQHSQILGMLTGTQISGVKTLIIGIILFIVEFVLSLFLFKYSKHCFKVLIIKLYLVFCFGILLMVAFSLIKHPIIQWRYAFPFFAMIYFLLIAFIINSHIFECKKHVIIYSFLVLLLVLFFNLRMCSFSSVSNFCNVDRIIIKRVKIPNSNRNIAIHSHSDNSEAVKAVFYSAYLLISKSHKKVVVYDLKPKYVLGNDNYKLMYGVYNNISSK